MQTSTFKIAGKTVAVVATEKRKVKKRYEITQGTTFTGFHFGKTSRFFHLPVFSKRSWGGVAEVKNKA